MPTYKYFLLVRIFSSPSTLHCYFKHGCRAAQYMTLVPCAVCGKLPAIDLASCTAGLPKLPDPSLLYVQTRLSAVCI